MKYSLPILKLYLSRFGDQDSREDGNAILSKATTVPLDPQKLSKKAVQEGVPWAMWLGLELLSGFVEGSERKSVFVYYRLLQGVIDAYVLVRPIENSGPCYELAKNLTDNRTESDTSLSNIRRRSWSLPYLWSTGPRKTSLLPHGAEFRRSIHETDW